ncbi:MAG: hypothetical protein D3920_10875 [Candidatus Electrothrix sp. AW2]|nr:hypothetical protein [Candidatus Electrothrix gigas]
MFALAASSAFATAQYPDKVVYEGKEYSLHTNPMEAYFTKHPDKKPKNGVMSTALWRGYVATFEFKTNSLVLKDIEIEIWNEAKDDTSWKSVNDDVIPKGKDLVVDWFTGILVLPHGKLVNYVHMGYGSTYSNYILLEVKKGKLTGKRAYDHKKYEIFKEKQFQAFKKTEAYKKHAEELKKKEWSQDDIDSFLRSFVVKYSSEFLVEEEKKETSNQELKATGKPAP